MSKYQVCIEFDAERLSSTTDTKLISVRYKEPGDTDSDLKGAIEYYIDGKLDDLRSKRAIDPETVMEGARDLSLYVRSKFNPIGIKHAGFAEEQEWRLVGEFRADFPQASMIPDGKRFFIDRGRHPTPRVEIAFRDRSSSTTTREIHSSEIVKGVLFGPGSDRRRSNDLMTVINQMLSTSFKPEFSNVPYRT